MKCEAVVVREHGGIDQLRFETREVGEPAADAVRVRMRAIGLNSLDAWVRRGVLGHRFPLPLVTGSDGSGVVDAVGSGVRIFAPGDEVVALPSVSCGLCGPCARGQDHLCVEHRILGESCDGTCSEFVNLPVRNVARKPGNLSFAEAAAVPLVFQTAWAMLVRRAQLVAGETVLIHAAGSGVGSAAIQIAKLLGARVLATAGSAAKCDKARQLGAEHAIDYTAVDFTAEVRRLTDKRGVDVVFEHTGAKTWEGSLKCLARGGRLVTCGATTGADVPLNLRLLFFKNLTLLGNTLGTRGDIAQALALVEQGRLRPVVDRVLGWRQIGEAHALLEARAPFGKIVLALP